MSNALAISGVTAVLQYYLWNLYVSVAAQFPSHVKVSCLAPDQVQSELNSAGKAENQVNLFLHQVTHNAAWRNVELPSMSADGTRRLQSPPLALNLHYLLTAYGSESWQAEALLGYALMMLHESPVLTRNDITNALTALDPPLPKTPPFPNNPLSTFLGSIGLADQIEMIKITPETLGREEMAWLWTALKADYRPTFPFQVSVVLLQPALATSFALPVLQRVLGAQPMQPAQILQVEPPGNQTAAQPSDTVTVTGEFLSGASQVSLTNARYGVQLTLPVATVTATAITFALPADTTTYPAGVYVLEVQFLDSTGNVVQSTNTLPMAVAPVLASQTAVTSTSGSILTVTISAFSPQAWEGQTISLALSTYGAMVPPGTPVISVSAPAQPYTGNTGTLSFQFDSALPTGVGLLGRLQVDGVTSQVQVTTNPFPLPPSFSGPLVTLP
jgi:hypothetical protein